jgi:enediyne biosynthesis protein E4
MHGLPGLLATLSSLLSCAGVDTADSGDTQATTPPRCEPATLTLAQDLRESDLPAEASLEHTEHGVALADLDGDGDLDALVGWAAGVFGLRNDGTGKLVLDPSIDIDGAAWGVRGTALAVADLDQDGDVDAYVGEYPTGDLLLWNDGTGHFTSQRLSEGHPDYSPWSGSFGDADGDGDLDLYIATLVPNLEPEPVLDGSIRAGPNYLYVNRGGGDFARDDSRVPDEETNGLTFHAAWVDLDSDGDLDLYEANDWGYYVRPNRFLRNDGTGHFTEDDSCACQAPMYAMGVGVGDVQGDGLPDLVVTNLNTPNLFENIGGEMVDATRARGVYVAPSETNFTSWGTTFLDFDRNGCSDIAVAFGRLARDVSLDVEGMPEGAVDPERQANVMLMNDCTGHFDRLLDSDFDAYLDRDRAVSVGDLDGDGRADLVTAGKHFVRVWMAGGGCDNGVTIRLNQPGENSASLGAKVTMTANGQDQVQWMLPSSTHSSNALELVFGLGTATQGELSVLWPDGTQGEPMDVFSGDVLTVTR